MKSVRTCPLKRRKFPGLDSKACVFYDDDYCIYCNRMASDDE